ncbi:hypothetical protein [Nioella sp.]|uniref:hypothetical protein n=1 Tax=Nioella sp. TaxID=1912091 RepID=UPI003A8AC60A
MRQILIALCLTVFAAAAHAQAALDAVMAQATADCALYENGNLMVGEESTNSVDLTGDGEPEVILDAEFLRCSTMAGAPYCGSGGCSLYAFVGEDTFEWQALGWRVIDWDGEPVLLIGRDGGWCGVSSAGYCFEALNWNGETFLTVMTPVE